MCGLNGTLIYLDEACTNIVTANNERFMICLLIFVQAFTNLLAWFIFTLTNNSMNVTVMGCTNTTIDPYGHPFFDFPILMESFMVNVFLKNYEHF